MVSSGGNAVIVIRTEAEYSHFAKYRSGWRQRSPNYQEYKTRLAQALIREIDDLIPGLEKAILVMDVATPLTFEDQGGRSGGAVAGWSWDYEDLRDDQPKELIGTPITRPLCGWLSGIFSPLHGRNPHGHGKREAGGQGCP